MIFLKTQMNPPVLTLQKLNLTFGGNPLFNDLDLKIIQGDKIALIGRNGSGKSTLLKIIANQIEPDDGVKYCQPGIKIAYLPQNPKFDGFSNARDYVCQSGCQPYEAESFLGFLNISPDHNLTQVSGGEARRVSLAHTLAQNADILLLDEPTNHLDLPAIEWLEDYLKSYRGALLFISHDRSFLKNVSNSMVWLDRGQLLSCQKGFVYFDTWAQQKELEDEKYFDRLNNRLKLENQWLQTGVTARRKRNQGRLRNLMELRATKQDFISQQHKSAKLPTLNASTGSKLMVELDAVNFSYDNKQIVKNLTMRILRGDRIGIIGPNGVGKTSLLRLMVGQLKPDSGAVKLGKSINLVYFDQSRSSIDGDKTLLENLCPQGADQVVIQGVAKNAAGYLKEFLFTDKQIHGSASILSGGEKNRLALAMALAQPSNFLILDEPTNDLDMDTLDLLIDFLSGYEGTLLVVSHDRDFLDQLVTSVLVCEGQGKIQEYAGGYTDYVVYQKKYKQAQEPAKESKKANTKQEADSGLPKEPQKKLTYKLQRELELLPTIIERLNAQIQDLESKLNDPKLYAQDPKQFEKLSQNLIAQKAELDQAESRWLELEMMSQELM